MLFDVAADHMMSHEISHCRIYLLLSKVSRAGVLQNLLTFDRAYKAGRSDIVLIESTHAPADASNKLHFRQSSALKSAPDESQTTAPHGNRPHPHCSVVSSSAVASPFCPPPALLSSLNLSAITKSSSV